MIFIPLVPFLSKFFILCFSFLRDHCVKRVDVMQSSLRYKKEALLKPFLGFHFFPFDSSTVVGKTFKYRTFETIHDVKS